MVTQGRGRERAAAAKVESTSVVHEFFQQSNETDWDFLWRLALMHDYEVVVTDTKLELPQGEQDRGRADGAARGRTT